MPGIQKIPKEDVVAVIAKLGPCQPIDIRKELKVGDSFLIGALLSELVADGTLHISKTRRGGSPFYYDPNASESLEKIGQYLNEKDRRTLTLLKEQKVLREDAVDPLVRVGLKNIDDFSKRMELDGIVYWRHFLVSESEAKKLIGSTQIETAPELPKEVKETQEAPKETKETFKEVKEVVSSEEPKKAKKPRAPRVKKAPAQQTLSQSASMPTASDWLAHDTLYERVQKANFGIVTNPQSVKPNTELTCTITTDGPHGKLSVFAYALNKKKFTEMDISRALLQARGQGMPLLVLSVEEIPAKLVKAFDGQLNMYLKRF